MKNIFSDVKSKLKTSYELIVSLLSLILSLVNIDSKLNIEPTVKTSKLEVIIEKIRRRIACFFLLNDKTLHRFNSKYLIE